MILTPAPRGSPGDTARWLLDQGLWPVVTRHQRDKRPLFKDWGRKLPSEADIRSVYREHRRAGVAIALGPDAGVIDVEIDDPRAAAPLLPRLGLPPTVEWTSARGSHRLYRWDDQLARAANSAVVHLEGIEIRKGAAGKQLASVCPPSGGRRWADIWRVETCPDGVLLALEELRRPRRQPTPPDDRKSDRYALAALRGESARVRSADNGERNRTLNAAAWAMGRLIASGLVDRRTVEAELTDAALSVGLGEREIAATLKSAIEARLRPH